jgi:hypothetical protein
MAPDNNAASNAPDYVFWKFVNELIWDAERNKAHKNPSDGVSPWEDNTGE